MLDYAKKRVKELKLGDKVKSDCGWLTVINVKNDKYEGTTVIYDSLEGIKAKIYPNYLDTYVVAV